MLGTDTIILARTDANAANLITSDVDPYDAPFVTGERTSEGFFVTNAGLDQAIARGLAYAYADLIWCETATPDLDEARRLPRRSRRNIRTSCCPTTARRPSTGSATSTTPPSPSSRPELAAMGYRYQFITLASIHAMWNSMFRLANDYAARGMSAYVELQEQEFADADRGYTFVSHQQEVGAGASTM